MSWPKVELGSCCEIVSGATPKTTSAEYWDGDIRWATPKDLAELSGSYISDTPRRITTAGLRSCAATVLPPGSVLLSSRAPIGYVAITTEPMATNQGFKSLVPDKNRVSAEYLAQWLKANRSYLEGLGNGATFKEISKATVSRVKLPLPPLAVQERIADVLDGVDALRAKRRHAIALLDDLAQSVFLDMFGDPAANPKGWPLRQVTDLIDSATYGTSEKSSSSGDLPVLRMNNVTSSGQIDLSDLKYMDRASTPEKYLVRKGDVLFNRTNSAELVGKTAIYRGTEPLAFAGYLVRVRVNKANHPEYFAAFMNTGYAKLVLRNMCKSIIGMANINAKEMQRIAIAEPPLHLQQQFAERVEAIEAEKARHRAHLARLDELFNSVQSRAFAGTLFG